MRGTTVVCDISLDKLSIRLQKIDAGITKAMQVSVVEAADEAVKYAKSNHVYKDRTGALTRSIKRSTTITTRNIVSANIMATAKHARYVEFPTKAHVIEARRARFLRFWHNGVLVITKRVNHPGHYRNHAFMRPAAEHGRAIARRKIIQACAGL